MNDTVYIVLLVEGGIPEVQGVYRREANAKAHIADLTTNTADEWEHAENWGQHTYTCGDSEVRLMTERIEDL